MELGEDWVHTMSLQIINRLSSYGANRMTRPMRQAMLALEIQGGEAFISAAAAKALAFRGWVRLLPSDRTPEVLRSRHTENYRAELTEAGWALRRENIAGALKRALDEK